MNVKLKEIIKPTAVLTVICLVIVALLAAVNLVTGPVIEAAKNAAANEALLEVYPEGSFGADSKIEDLTSYALPKEITAVYKEESGGYVFQATVTGYQTGMIIMCGVDPGGKIVGTKVIANNETPDKAAPLFKLTDTDGAYKGATLDAFPTVSVAGATYTSDGYAAAVKAALNAFVIMNGGEVDLRTPEEILQDNCNAALGTEGKVFVKWFAGELLTTADNLYITDGGAVAVIGEDFVGINADGAAVGEVDEALKTAAETAWAERSAATVEVPEGAKKSIVKEISRAANGDYLLSLKAAGYQATFEYGTGDYIYITLRISSEGRIVSLETTSHKESKGIDSQDKLNAYESEYAGKADEDIKVTVQTPDYHGDPQIPEDCTDVGAISGATYTTAGYQKAVKAAFEAFRLLTEGGASND